MKPSYTITLSRRPQVYAEQVAVSRLMHVVDLCFQAFKLEIRSVWSLIKVENLFNDKTRERIAREVSSTTRMVAFISYHGDHTLVDITFSERKTPVKMIRVRYDHYQKQLILIAEISP